MLQLEVIRQKAPWVKERLAFKNFKQIEIVDQIVALDEAIRRNKTMIEANQSNMNNLSKQFPLLNQQKNQEESDKLRLQVNLLKEQQLPLQEEMAEKENQLTEYLWMLPNLPSSMVPRGTTPEENEIVREAGQKPILGPGSAPHWDLAKRYDLIDFELGNKVTGSGFPFYKHKGAKIQRALIQYFLDYNTAAGYTEYSPPLMVNEASAFGTGQLPDKEGQMYFIGEDKFYLIPTAEVPLTNIYRDQIVKENDLPLKMTAYTPCFRREAGNYGKDVRGLNRLHQFDKVEIVQLTHPDKSYAVLEDMVIHVEGLLQSLELPYRILRLCGGDMGFASALTYDFEVYSAAQEKWLEVSSVSNFEAFQANRLKARFKDATGKNLLVHSLNGSSLALPRILAALLENNQTENSILLPRVLHGYFGGSSIS
jgi:seryl-tRNA synthetase